MHNTIAALALTFTALAIAPAWADSKVTLCASDRQPGAGTNLATAIQAGGLITFDCKGPATLQMSASHSIERSVVIDGGGQITLREGNESMFAARRQGGALELKGLKFQDTKHRIVDHSLEVSIPITITTSTFTNSDAPFAHPRNGAGPLVIRDSVFTNNAGVVVNAGDALTIERSKFERTKGMAVFNFGPNSTTKIVDSVFSGNSSGGLMVGTGFADDQSLTLEIVRSTFLNNGGDEKNPRGDGKFSGAVIGAVLFRCNTSAKSCTLKVSSSKFSGNRAEDGGAVHVSGVALVSLKNVRFESNVAKGLGGAVFFDAESAPNPKLELQHAVFTSNRATFGGAVSVKRSGLVGAAITFSKNEAKQTGGAIGVDGDVQITQGVFVDNVAVSGSAAAVNARSVFANTLMARNRATLNGALLGGTFVGADARFVNSTIMDNLGGGIVHVTPPGSVGPRPIVLRNTIVAANSGANCQSGAAAQPPGVGSSFVSDGNNLEFPTNTCSPTISVAEPNLDPLFIPVLGSPAKGNGDLATCLGELVSARDVYGKRRPQGISCSIGAAEGELDKQVVDRILAKGGVDNNESKTGKGGGVGQRPPEANQCCCCCAMGSCGR